MYTYKPNYVMVLNVRKRRLITYVEKSMEMGMACFPLGIRITRCILRVRKNVYWTSD